MERKKDVVTIDIVRPTGPRVIPEPIRSKGYLERYIPRRSLSRLKQGFVAVATVVRRPKVTASVATIALAICVHLATSTMTHFVAMPFWTFAASNKAAMDPQPASSYTGPGDVVSGALVFGSCARAYNAAYANGTNPLCDLVDSAAPTTVICTLRVLTTGFVDLTGTYCTGGVTPATKCAAATGAVCNVSQVYDQTGNSRHFTQTTAANQPVLAFSALNSLPAMVCNGSTTIIATPNITQSQPFSAASVWVRATGTSAGSAIGAGSGGIITLGASAGANTASIGGASVVIIPGSTADGSYHYLVGAWNSTSSAYNIDGTDATSQNFGTGAFSGNTFRICSNGAAFINGRVTEGALWPSDTTPTQRGDLNTNARSSSGYGSF